MDRDHQLSAVLADETRYRIYRAIAEHPGHHVTVADIASRFGLHPNVARMHLGKLERAGFLNTGLRRNAGGGRPAKLYRLGDTAVTFGFPPRRYDLLSRLALGALGAGGSHDEIERVCREAGVAEGRRALADRQPAPSEPAAVGELVRRVAEEQGLLPEVDCSGRALRVVVNNCAFREVSGDEPELVCAMHRAFISGVLEVVTAGLGSAALDSGGARISTGDACCEITCTFSR